MFDDPHQPSFIAHLKQTNSDTLENNIIPQRERNNQASPKTLYFLIDKVTTRSPSYINSKYISNTISTGAISKYNSIYVWDNIYNIIPRIESLIDFNSHKTYLYDTKSFSKEDE